MVRVFSRILSASCADRNENLLCEPIYCLVTF